jgi:hypothetical protein
VGQDQGSVEGLGMTQKVSQEMKRHDAGESLIRRCADSGASCISFIPHLAWKGNLLNHKSSTRCQRPQRACTNLTHASTYSGLLTCRVNVPVVHERPFHLILFAVINLRVNLTSGGSTDADHVSKNLTRPRRQAGRQAGIRGIRMRRACMRWKPP